MLWIVFIELGIIVNIGFELCNYIYIYIYIYAIYSFMHFVSFIAFFVALLYNPVCLFFFSFTISTWHFYVAFTWTIYCFFGIEILDIYTSFDLWGCQGLIFFYCGFSLLDGRTKKMYHNWSIKLYDKSIIFLLTYDARDM